MLLPFPRRPHYAAIKAAPSLDSARFLYAVMLLADALGLGNQRNVLAVSLWRIAIHA